MGVSSTVAISSSPAVNDLWALAYLAKADWVNNVMVRTSYETDVKFADDAAEQRRGLRATPYRTITVSAGAEGKRNALRLRMAITRFAQSRSLVPIYPDATVVTADVATTDTDIPCDTTYRRIGPGMRVVILKDTCDTMPSFEVAEISVKTDSLITLTAGVSTSYPKGSIVIPVMEALVSLNNRGMVITDEVVNVNIVGVETPSAAQLPFIGTPGVLPSGVATHGGYPIFSHKLDFNNNISWGINRLGQIQKQGIDSVPNVYGDRGRFQPAGTVTCLSRKDAWALLEFFGSRGGQLYPFWFVSPISDITPVSVSGTSIVVKADMETTKDWDYQPYLAFLLTDGTVNIRKVNSVSRSGVQDTLTIDAVVTGMTINNIVAVYGAFLSRFESDEIEERWETDQVMQANITITEVLQEKDITISDLDEIVTRNLASPCDPSNGAVAKTCYDIYTATYTCADEGWSDVAFDHNACLLASTVTNENQWVFDQTLSEGVVQYVYYQNRGVSCTTSGDCPEPGTPPDAPAFAPSECCGCSEKYCLRATTPEFYVSGTGTSDIVPVHFRIIENSPTTCGDPWTEDEPTNVEYPTEHSPSAIINRTEVSAGMYIFIVGFALIGVTGRVTFTSTTPIASKCPPTDRAFWPALPDAGTGVTDFTWTDIVAAECLP